MFRRSSSDLSAEMGPNSGAPIHDDDWFKEKSYRAEESKEPLISPNKVTESGKMTESKLHLWKALPPMETSVSGKEKFVNEFQYSLTGSA